MSPDDHELQPAEPTAAQMSEYHRWVKEGGEMPEWLRKEYDTPDGPVAYGTIELEPSPCSPPATPPSAEPAAPTSSPETSTAGPANEVTIRRHRDGHFEVWTDGVPDYEADAARILGLVAHRLGI